MLTQHVFIHSSGSWVGAREINESLMFGKPLNTNKEAVHLWFLPLQNSHGEVEAILEF